MTPWAAAPGQTLLIPSGPSGTHLHFILLGPVVLENYGRMNQVCMVNITSIREGIPHDAACVLDIGDHPFIQHQSYVAYRHMRIDRCTHVEEMVNRLAWKSHTPCSAELLQRLIDGVCKSKLTSREYKLIFGCS